jgi:hypothetical protein
MPEKNPNLEGVNNDLAEDIKASFNYLRSQGEVAVITDEQEINLMLAEFANSGINIFDGYTQFQNVFKLNNCYLLQIRRQKVYRGIKGEVIVLNEYDLSSIVYKQAPTDYGKLTIEPAEYHIPLIAKFLSHIFSSDDVFISGHHLFNSKYRVRATDKAVADQLLTDPLLDAIGGDSNIHVLIVHDKILILHDGISRDATSSIMGILSLLPV